MFSLCYDLKILFFFAICNSEQYNLKKMVSFFIVYLYIPMFTFVVVFNNCKFYFYYFYLCCCFYRIANWIDLILQQLKTYYFSFITLLNNGVQ